MNVNGFCGSIGGAVVATTLPIKVKTFDFEIVFPGFIERQTMELHHQDLCLCDVHPDQNLRSST